MDENNQVDFSVWATAKLGRVIDVAIDRTIHQQQVIVDPAQAYGVDDNGNIYRLGQYNVSGQNLQTVTPQAKKIPSLLLILGVILLVEMAK
jgi:hypothetical protein